MPVFFSSLAVAARRLGLDDTEMAESVLCRIGDGYGELEAVRMSIVDELRKRGAYCGKVRQAVESGVIFQMEGGGDVDGKRNRENGARPSRRGRDRVGNGSAISN